MSKNNEIHKELRIPAAFFKFFLPSYQLNTLKLAKTYFNRKKGKCNLDLFFEERFIKKNDGSLLRICIYAKKVRKYNAPGILWMHGGGYGLGTPEMNEKLFETLIEETNAVIISPDYTLSIDKPYPEALYDCYEALKFMYHFGNMYMIDKNKIIVGGDSAGGGLACALSLYARDKNEIPIMLQIPLYPMIDDRMITESSKNLIDPIWNSKSNEMGWKFYLGDLFGENNVPYYAAPARATDLSNLPTFISYVGSVEPFKDEVIDYVNRLQKTGVKTYFKIFEGGYHAFDQMHPKSSIAKDAKFFLINSIKDVLDKG